MREKHHPKQVIYRKPDHRIKFFRKDKTLSNQNSRRIKSLDNRSVSDCFASQIDNPNEITLENILDKLYFENYNFNDVKDHLDSAILRLKDTQSFFNIVCQSIRNFTEVYLFL